MPNDNWTTASNWSHGPIVAGDTLQFNGSDTSPTSNNDESTVNPYDLELDTSGYDLTGNGIDITDAGGTAILADNPSGTNTLDLPLTLTAGATANVTTAGASLVVNNTLTSSAGMTFTTEGAGTLVLSASSDASALAGGVDDQGPLQVDTPNGPAQILLDGGTLSGVGTVGTITASATGGVLSPGDSGIGTLTAGSVTLNAASTFAVTLDGAGAGQYSQLAASGTVNLAGAKLSIDLGYSPANTDSYVLIQNTSNSPVQGTFAGLPQGSTVTINNIQFIINYQGGPAGNEVTLSVNGPPVANPDFYTLPENDQNFSVFAPGILGNDTDPSGHTLHPILVTQPTHGTLTLNDDGSFSYVPATGFTGTDTFTYEATDGLLDSNPATVTLVVNPVNSPPVAASVTYSVVENNAFSTTAPGVLAGAVSPQGLPLTADLVSGPTHGTITWDANDDGGFLYTPATGYTGNDSFTFDAVDSNGLTSAPATVTLVVQDVPSTVVSSAFTLNENTPIAVPAPGVLAGDTNPTHNPLTAIVVNGPADGTLALNPNGSFTYAPNPGFSGTDSFTFKANDGTLDSNTATVTLSVTAAPVAPTTIDSSFSVKENQTLAVAAPGLLLGDQNPSGGTLSLVVVNGPIHGSFTAGPANDGSFTYVPATNFSGTDSFTYYLSANGLESNVSTVTITVAQVPQTPIATNVSYSTSENGSLVVAAPGVLGNDSDPNGALLTAVLATSPADGSLVLNADGSFTYTPNPNFFGTDSFTYQASNGTLLSTPATVTINVAQVGIAPTAADHSYSAQENQALVVAAPGLLLGSQNPNGGAITVVVVSAPSHGSFTAGPADDGSFTYQPAANYSGTDSFTYYIEADGLTSNVATTTIAISQVAVAPIAHNDSYSTNENAPLTVAAPGVLGNDIDPNGLPLSAILQSGPAHGTLQLNSNGSFTYTPAANYSGSDSFTYLAYDGQLESNVATVSLTVVPVVLPPTTQNSSYTVQEDDQLVVSAPGILGSAIDPQGLSLQAILVNGTLDGSLSLNPNGSFIYTPNMGFTGTDSFSFKASDGQLLSNLSTVTINVAAIPGTTVQLASGVPDHGGFTNDTTPTYVGTTLPGLTVTLYAQTAGGQPKAVGQTTADASGHFSVTSTTLADGSYSFWVNATRANGLSTGSVSATGLTIDTSPPRITDVFIVPRTGQIMITFQAGTSGMNLASITDPANYSFSRRSTPGVRDYVITSVTLVPPSSTTGPVTVAIRSSAGKPIPAGRYLFSILSGGISDTAGNRLEGTFNGTFPTGGSAGSAFNALFLSKDQKPSNPVATHHFIPVLTVPGKHRSAARTAAATSSAAHTDLAAPAGPLAHPRFRRDSRVAERRGRGIR